MPPKARKRQLKNIESSRLESIEKYHRERCVDHVVNVDETISLYSSTIEDDLALDDEPLFPQYEYCVEFDVDTTDDVVDEPEDISEVIEVEKFLLEYTGPRTIADLLKWDDTSIVGKSTLFKRKGTGISRSQFFVNKKKKTELKNSAKQNSQDITSFFKPINPCDDIKVDNCAALDRLPLAFVRRVSRYCIRFMDGYRAGLEGPLLDYAMKRYAKHREIPKYVVDWLNKLTTDFENGVPAKLKK